MKYKIPDIVTYTSEMAKAVKDKLWFLDHVWVESMVDIGTADATIPIEISKMIGRDHDFDAKVYEPNVNLFWEARINVNRLYDTPEGKPNIEIYNEHIKFANAIKGKRTDLCLLSSVLHEVYDDKYGIIKFWNLVRLSNARYVAIRDMNWDGGNIETPRDVSNAIFSKGPIQRAENYNQILNLSNYNNAMQYLLKHRYHANWDLEVKENYFSVNWKEIHKLMKVLGYKRTYKRFFIPPFIKSNLKDTFGLTDLPNTHCEMIYKKIL